MPASDFGCLQLRADLNLNGIEQGRHRQRIESLRLLHHHDIIFLSNEGISCIPFALELDVDQYREIASLHDGRIFAGRRFFGWLIDRGYLRELNQRENGCLIAYYNDDNIWQHVGVIVGDRVRSKWGNFPAYEHRVFDIPDTYGSSPRFFRKPTPAEALARFLLFAKEMEAGLKAE